MSLRKAAMAEPKQDSSFKDVMLKNTFNLGLCQHTIINFCECLGIGWNIDIMLTIS